MATGEQYLKDLAEQQRQATMAGLKSQYQQGLSALDAEQATIDPRYQQQATMADVATQRATKRLQEIMANRGYASGQQVSQTGAMLASGQQAQSDLGLQRQQAFDTLGRQRTNLDQGYATGQAGATADTQSQLIQNLYNHYMQSQSFDYQKQQDALAQQNWQTQWDYQLQQDANRRSGGGGGRPGFDMAGYIDQLKAAYGNTGDTSGISTSTPYSQSQSALTMMQNFRPRQYTQAEQPGKVTIRY